jgi:hypothetical protein
MRSARTRAAAAPYEQLEENKTAANKETTPQGAKKPTKETPERRRRRKGKQLETTAAKKSETPYQRVSVASPKQQRGQQKATITHGKTKSSARDVAAVGICEHMASGKLIGECGGSGTYVSMADGGSVQRIAAAVLYEHMWQAEGSVQCSGSGICEHKQTESSVQRCGGEEVLYVKHGRQELSAKCSGSYYM